MTSPHSSFSHRPFEDLARLLKGRVPEKPPVKLPGTREKTVCPSVSAAPLSDRQLFLGAVGDVTPLGKQNRSMPPAPSGGGQKGPSDAEEFDPREKLERLVASGEGFVVSQTPEYMEGTGHQVPKGITDQLHRGRFSIQDHIDLHGMDAPGALDAMDRFLQRATLRGLRSVLVVHGRGLSSPGEPVLKSLLRELLAGNRWQRWILAFSSARSCDGGAGATYILLRKRPLSKKKRKHFLKKNGSHT